MYFNVLNDLANGGTLEEIDFRKDELTFKR